MTKPWIADRTRAFDSSGIRKVFDLARQMESPINLSIGQPDYDVPDPVRDACIQAIQSRKNGYALTQGMPVLREKLQARIRSRFGHADRTGIRVVRDQRRFGTGPPVTGQSGRRGDHVRPVFRHVRIA